MSVETTPENPAASGETKAIRQDPTSWRKRSLGKALLVTLIVALALGWIALLLEVAWHYANYESFSAERGKLWRAVLRAEARPAAVGMVTSLDAAKGVVEVTIGSNDGLHLGDELDAFRHVSDGKIKEVWLTGRFRIIEVGSVVSTGKIIYLVEANPAQRGDMVPFYRKLDRGREPHVELELKKRAEP